MNVNVRNRIIEVVGAIVIMGLVVLGCYWNSASIIFSLIACVALIAIFKDRKMLRMAFTFLISALLILETMGILYNHDVINISIFSRKISTTFVIDIAFIGVVIIYLYLCAKAKTEAAENFYRKFIIVKNIVCYVILAALIVFLAAALKYSKDSVYDFVPKDGEKVLILPCADKEKAVTVFDRLDIHLDKKEYGKEQIFLLKDAGDGYFYIQAYNEENVLDIYQNKYEPGTPIIEWFNLNADNQKWKFTYINERGYVMNSLASEQLYMSLSTDNYSDMVLSWWTGTNDHFFTIEKYSIWSELFEISGHKKICICLLAVAVLSLGATIFFNTKDIISRRK